MTHTPLTKAEREELRRLHDYASGRFTMRINGENDCRVELANGPSDDERGLHARFRYATGAHAFVAIHNHLPRLLADLDAAEAERDALRGTLRRHGFQLCDIAACNCNGWHQTGGFYARFNEIDEAVGEHDGKTLLDAVKQIVSERDEAVALIDAAKSDVRPESFLEHAQAILAKCIAPYSCEQMKAVGDALAGCYRKWELMSEVALKAKDDADSMAKCKGCGGTVSDHLAPDQGGCPGSFEIDGVQMVPLAGRDNAVAQRDRAESELDAERKMRIEAEAAATRAEAESATFSRRLAEALVRNDEDDLGCDRARMEEMRDERDALKAQEGEWADQISAALNSTADKLGRTPSMIAGHVRREHEAHTACFDRLRKAVDERDALKARLGNIECLHCGDIDPDVSHWEQCKEHPARATVDALKAKLADPRRVVIHETEVVATKEELATLRSERDKFANWIAMEHRGGPDWACAQCKPPTHGNNMVVEGFVCIRHRAMAIASACGGVS